MIPPGLDYFSFANFDARARTTTRWMMNDAVKRALIFGVSGQDGAYLSQLLLDRGYEVHGTSRDAESQSFRRLDAPRHPRSRARRTPPPRAISASCCSSIDSIRPDEIYNLAGQSSVGLSFSQPVEAMDSIAQATLVLLEVIRYLKLPGAPLQLRVERMFRRTSARRRQRRDDAVLPAQPVRDGESHRALDDGRTTARRTASTPAPESSSITNRRCARERFVTKKIVTAAAEIAAGKPQPPHARRPRRLARLGLRARIRRGDVAHAAAGRAATTSSSPPARATRSKSSSPPPSPRSAWTGSEHVDIDPALFRAVRHRATAAATPRRRAARWDGKRRRGSRELVRIMAEAERAALDLQLLQRG